MEPIAPFRYRSYPLSLHAGKGALAALRDEVDRVRAKRAFVVCGRSIATRTDLVERIEANLGAKYAGAFTGVQASSPLPAVLAGAQAAKEACADCVVAVGGGSAMVTARAITIVLAETGDIRDLCTQYPPGQPPVSPKLLAPKIPNILVLTTPSTAMTRAGSAVKDVEHDRRLELFDPKTRPCAMIWDDDALGTAPADLFVSTAASALSGIFCGVASPRINPISHADLLHAMRISLQSLPLLAKTPNDPTARMNLVAASFLSNRALDAMRSRAFGIISSFGHVIDTLYPHVTHGESYSLTTAWGMRFNLDPCLAGLARLGRELGLDKGRSDRDAAMGATDFVEAFYRDLGLPVRLRDVGVAQNDIQKIAQDCMGDFYLHQNARKVKSADELLDVLKRMW